MRRERAGEEAEQKGEERDEEVPFSTSRESPTQSEGRSRAEVLRVWRLKKLDRCHASQMGNASAMWI
jgi:hypothetical protein